MTPVGELLSAAAAGDRRAAADLFPVVYDELRRLAAARIAAERPGHTLDPTALVHEAFLRLIGPANADGFAGRGHFVAAAAEAMRRILVDHARAAGAQKRAGRRADGHLDQLPAPSAPPDVLDLDDALTRLAEIDPQAARLVTLRHFGGLTVAEAAEHLGVAPRTADRLWAFARAFLYRELSTKSE